MKQTKLSKQESPLLDSAISRLRPGVFSHPVWVRFGNQNKSAPTGTIKNLFIEAENLKGNHPSDACQVLLICAVYQNYFGQTNGALTTIQQAQNLAEKTGLSQEYLWTLWGASAVCVQRKDFEGAARYLDSLKHLLDQQNEWVLANYVETVRQALQQPSTVEMTPQDNPAERQAQSVENLLALTFRWLNLWGFSVQTLGPDLPSQGDPVSTQGEARPLFSVQRWQGRWSSIRLMFEGEIKFHRLDIGTKAGRKRTSIWDPIKNLFHGRQVSGRDDAVVVDVEEKGIEETLSGVQDELPPAMLPLQETTSISTREQVEDSQPTVQSASVLPISIYMLGFFRMTIKETSIKLPASRSLSLLKYLLLKHAQNTPRDVLMDIFWPDVEPEKARNNLNVAIYNIRKALRQYTDVPFICYEDNAYGVASEIEVWLDVDEFERLVKRGKQLEAQNQLDNAVSKYEAAISLYQGDFLEENPYEGWTALTRERLRMAYLETLDRLNQIYYSQSQYAMCITLSQLILTRDRCREDAHYMLMRCYSHQGQDHLALRQYQVCKEALLLELEVDPSPATTQLFEQIRQHKEI